MIFWIFFLILSLIVEVYLWWKLQASLIFLSGRTCTIGGWLNTFLPHCIIDWWECETCIIFSKAPKADETPSYIHVCHYRVSSSSTVSRLFCWGWNEWAAGPALVQMGCGSFFFFLSAVPYHGTHHICYAAQSIFSLICLSVHIEGTICHSAMLWLRCDVCRHD